MKKQIAVALLAAAAGLSLAGCNLTKTSTSGTSSASSDSSTEPTLLAATDLDKEVASTSLFVSMGGTSAVKNTLARRSATSTNDSSSADTSSPITDTASPITIDPSDPSATLASFDELTVDDYSLKATAVASDRSDYANEENLTYVLPNGEAEAITLYFGTPAVANDSSSEVSSSAATSDVASKNKPGAFSTNYDNVLHGYGYGSGAFGGMLGGRYGFMTFSKTAGDVSLTYTRTLGLAVSTSFQSDFVSEEMTAVTSQKTYHLYAFALLLSSTSFVSVEQAYITNGTDTRSVYAYASVDDNVATRFLLQNTADTTRLVYLDNLEKVAINRFVDNGNTYYSIHVREGGMMALAGVYEKVVTTDSSGVTTTTYVKVDYAKDNLTVPSEN